MGIGKCNFDIQFCIQMFNYSNNYYLYYFVMYQLIYFIQMRSFLFSFEMHSQRNLDKIQPFIFDPFIIFRSYLEPLKIVQRISQIYLRNYYLSMPSVRSAKLDYQIVGRTKVKQHLLRKPYLIIFLISFFLRIQELSPFRSQRQFYI